MQSIETVNKSRHVPFLAPPRDQYKTLHVIYNMMKS